MKTIIANYFRVVFYLITFVASVVTLSYGSAYITILICGTKWSDILTPIQLIIWFSIMAVLVPIWIFSIDKLNKKVWPNGVFEF